MTVAQQVARSISDYLLTGMHHATRDGQAAMAAIVAQALAERGAEQSAFFVDCLRDCLRDKDRQIARLSS